MPTEILYRYSERSSYVDGEGLRLETSAPSRVAGASDSPVFFSGFVEHPAAVAAALLVVARTARQRFFTPAAALAVLVRDPVVTSTPEGLRFESFSACGGVYARLDLDASALDSEVAATGVTNVDVGEELRAALAGITGSEPLHLSVGTSELRVETLDDDVVEKKVPLPTRWLRGFAEAQAAAARMAPRARLDGAAARRFIAALPAGGARAVSWATPSIDGLRLATRPSPGAVCVAGPERLRLLAPVLRFATGLTGYGVRADIDSAPLASMWTADLPGARLTIGLSPEASRGFSGEGGVLLDLAHPDAHADAERVGDLLAMDARIDADRIAEQLGLPPDRIERALTVLAVSGQVGYDLAAGAYFHRPLPFRATAMLGHNPRLRTAQKLVAAGGIRLGEGGTVLVRSGDADHVVRLASPPAVDVALGATACAGDECSCPWFGAHRGTRGPCAHVLAARIVVEPDAS